MSSRFARLFRQEPQFTSLGGQLRFFTRESATQAHRNFPLDDKLRVAKTISMLVLAMANDFSSALTSPQSVFGAKLSAAKRLATYDVAVWEIAAYGHYWLMKELELEGAKGFCSSSEDGEWDNTSYSELMKSALLTGHFIADFTKFDAEFFWNRANSYCRSSDTKIDTAELSGRLEHKLYCSIQAGRPVQAKVRESEDSNLETTLKLSIELLHVAFLPALSHLVNHLFQDED
jgi:formate dehydrogenase maturation protein FdhE